MFMKIVEKLGWDLSSIDEVFRLNNPSLASLFEQTRTIITARQRVNSLIRERYWEEMEGVPSRQSFLSHLEAMYYPSEEEGGTKVKTTSSTFPCLLTLLNHITSTPCNAGFGGAHDPSHKRKLSQPHRPKRVRDRLENRPRVVRARHLLHILL